jgi:hypothetical protein
MNRSDFLKTILISSVSAPVLLTGCEGYLNKDKESNISAKDVFGSFLSFQGFVEEMYNCVFDKNKGQAWNPYLFADERLNNKPYPFDAGNYRPSRDYFYGKSVTPDDGNPRTKRVWEYAWYAIRKANVSLAKLQEKNLFSGTKEEKNLLKGQALYFRGWYYFQICKFWGGMPYVTKALNPSEKLFTPDFKRLNFQQTAKLMAKDFRAAADVLPTSWDNTKPGQRTKGQNRQRVDKFFALGYLGKSLLYGGSPMMNEEATGSDSHNPDFCQEAAEALGKLLKLTENTGMYKLQSWNSWTDNFWRLNGRRPGGTEVIMGPTIYNPTRVRWSTEGATVPSSMGLNSGSNADVPTHNNIKNYRMANGLPIDDPNSGFNPNDPWTGREPRFYKDIVYDGVRISNSIANNIYAKLYNGGYHRSQINPPSVTGYYSKKFVPMGPDWTISQAGGLQAYVPYLRLADVYLMYAEAVLFSKNGGNPKSTSGNYHLTAEQAVNVVRNRAKLPDLDSKYTSSKELFFNEGIMRERAVELNFEGSRFLDLRRWNLNGDPRFLNKTAIDFDRGKDGKPTNVKERIITKRVAGKKQNWLPIIEKFTKQYPGFPQNPGW